MTVTGGIMGVTGKNMAITGGNMSLTGNNMSLPSENMSFPSENMAVPRRNMSVTGMNIGIGEGKWVGNAYLRCKMKQPAMLRGCLMYGLYNLDLLLHILHTTLLPVFATALV